MSASLSENITPDQIVSASGLPTITGMVRQPSGGWTFYFRFNGWVMLADGRRVEITRPVALRATGQIGRKPPRMTA